MATWAFVNRAKAAAKREAEEEELLRFYDSISEELDRDPARAHGISTGVVFREEVKVMFEAKKREQTEQNKRTRTQAATEAHRLVSGETSRTTHPRDPKIRDKWDDLIGPPQSGQSQADRCSLAVQAGMLYEDVATVYPTMGNQIRALLLMLQGKYDLQLSKRRTFMNVFLFIGATGTGKTTIAYDLAKMASKEGDHYTLTQIGKGAFGQAWFDGYHRQRTLIIDEYKGNEYSCVDLLNWTNPRRETMLSVKGSSTWPCWTTVIITSNNALDTWTEPNRQPWTPENRAAFMNRLTQTWIFKSQTDIDIIDHRPMATTAPAPIVKPDKATQKLNGMKELFEAQRSNVMEVDD